MLLTNFGRLTVLKHDAVAAGCDLIRAHIYGTANKIVLVRDNIIHSEFPWLLFNTLVLSGSVWTVQTRLGIDSLGLGTRPLGTEVGGLLIGDSVDGDDLGVVVVDDDLLGHFDVIV